MLFDEIATPGTKTESALCRYIVETLLRDVPGLEARVRIVPIIVPAILIG